MDWCLRSTKPWPEPMLTNICDNMQFYQATMSKTLTTSSVYYIVMLWFLVVCFGTQLQATVPILRSIVIVNSK